MSNHMLLIYDEGFEPEDLKNATTRRLLTPKEHALVGCLLSPVKVFEAIQAQLLDGDDTDLEEIFYEMKRDLKELTNG